MKEIPIGLIFSMDGTYQHLAKNAYEGALYAISQINASKLLPSYLLKGVHADPRGVLENYAPTVSSLLGDNVQHIFGTITSSARKEVLPSIQSSNSLLWYGSPYEGYECDEHVVYHGACPNQNLYPLLQFAIPKFGNRVSLVASNYIWGWESNRIASELVNVAQGHVLMDRYYSLDDINFSDAVDAIVDQHPDFIVNNLVGKSSYAFLQQLNDQWSHAPLPVLSCNMTESELIHLPDFPNLKLISAGAFFETVNPDFVANVKAELGSVTVSANFMGAYLSIYTFAHACTLAKSTDPEEIRKALLELSYASPLHCDLKVSENQHANLPCYIAEWNHNKFDILFQTPAIKANPFLSAESSWEMDVQPKEGLDLSRPQLRLVS